MDSVILMPGQQAVETFRKNAARRHDKASFGTTVATPASWLARLWEVWGDGRAIASHDQRSLAFSRVLSSQDQLPASFGMASILIRLADEALGTPQLDAALDGDSGLDSDFGPMFAAVRAYEETLREAGLVDPGRAWGVLSRARAMRRSTLVTFMGMQAPAVLRLFCERQGCRIEEPDSSCVISTLDGVNVRFAFPSGGTAQPLLLVDLIAEFIERGCSDGVVVTAKDPRALYADIAPALSCRGVACALAGGTPFSCTDFGRALLCVRDAVESNEAPVTSLTDYLLNPFSGISSERAYELNAAMRADRLVDREACLELVRRASSSFEYFEELVASPDASVLTGAFEDRVRTMAETTEAYRAEQLAALSCLRNVAEDARRFGLGMSHCFEILERKTVSVSRAMGVGDPSVRIMDMRQASMLGKGSCSALVMCDMTSASYPLRERDDAAASLCAALGVPSSRSTLAEARRIFAAASSIPSRDLVIERCLKDENASDTYPAAVVEEFVDRYRRDPTDADEVDNPYTLPPLFLSTIIERGEESLYENASVRHGSQAVEGEVPMPTLAHVGERSASRLVLPRLLPKHGVLARPCFSASQIESYLECPQKWFALRRLRLDELDEGFGAVEMGDFSHHALEKFYRRFQEDVAPKVSPDALPLARAIMRDVVAESRAKQYARSASENRLVPINELERRQADELGERLVAYLDREACILPEYRPAYFEFAIPVSSAVDYAGYKLVGSVDRIDVDDAGHAVIIDYKSSLSPDYDLYDSSGQERGGKVQALIYAQAVRRILGLDVVGAVYVSYGRAQKISGAIDVRLEPLHLPGLKSKACVYGQGPLSDLLDATEARVAEALDLLLSGDVAPRPATNHACAWCPELSCPERQG